MLIGRLAVAALLALAAPGPASDPVPPGAGAQLVADLRDARAITDGTGVTVALLSSAVDPDAAGLTGKVTRGPDYVRLPGPAMDYGTGLAEGIAGDGSSPGNPLNSLGIAPGARILSIRVEADGNEAGAEAFNSTASFTVLLARGIRYAADHHAGVIYIDWMPATADSAALESAIAYALARNVIVATVAVSGAGGYTPDRVGYPAGVPGVIGAGMITVGGLPAPYEQVAGDTAANNSVLAAVPDNTLHELGPGGDGEDWDGYIAGGAWLAGTLALIKAAYPFLTPAQVGQALALSARYHPSDGYDTAIGFGLINPYGALTEAGLLALGSGPAARPGLAASAHFGPGQPPGPVVAAPRQGTLVAVFGALTALGLALLRVAYLLNCRWRIPR